jgi:hypothetical protein
MALLIEDQMHNRLIELEEERCIKLEQENLKDPKKAGKKIKRKKIDKPWKRSYPVSLCQEYDLMLLVTDYDYDLSDEHFQKYCAERGVLQVAGEIGSRRWEYMLDYTKLKEDFFNDAYFQYAKVKEDGSAYKYSDEEMNIHWENLFISRVQLQDCWEIYCKIDNTNK